MTPQTRGQRTYERVVAKPNTLLFHKRTISLAIRIQRKLQADLIYFNFGVLYIAFNSNQISHDTRCIMSKRVTS